MSVEQEVKVKVKGILGVAKPFWQGGSLRLTIPKRALKARVNNKTVKDTVDSGEYFAFVFVKTNKGFLLVPFTKFVNPSTLREKLSFIDLSKITDEELEVLLEEE